MFTENSEITYAEAISKASIAAAQKNEKVIFLGIGVQYPSGMFGTTNELYKMLGGDRVIDTPAMENGLTGIAVGLCKSGYKPVIIHARSDFMLLSFDSLVNLVAKWNYMFGGNSGRADVVVRSIIGRGWGQGATHSQSFHSLLAHVPGIRILLPSTVADAYSMTYASLVDDIPTVIFEHRSLYSVKGRIRDSSSPSNFETPTLLRKGSHITLAGYSYATHQLSIASEILQQHGISADLFDLRSLNLSNLDELADSIKKTKNVLFHDVSWVPYGANSEIITRLIENNVDMYSIKVKRTGNYFSPAPTSEYLENFFYPSIEDIVKNCFELLGRDTEILSLTKKQVNSDFVGPY